MSDRPSRVTRYTPSPIQATFMVPSIFADLRASIPWIPRRPRGHSWPCGRRRMRGHRRFDEVRHFTALFEQPRGFAIDKAGIDRTVTKVRVVHDPEQEGHVAPHAEHRI